MTPRDVEESVGVGVGDAKHRKCCLHLVGAGVGKSAWPPALKALKHLTFPMVLQQ